MKVIDLLQRIANGEEVPKRIRYQLFELDRTYSTDIRTYYVDKEGMFFFKDYSYMLNDEVEIIEEDKKDEEIEIYVNGKEVDITDIYEPLKQGEYIYKENGKWYVHKLKNVSFVIEEDKKIEKIDVAWQNVFDEQVQQDCTKMILNKINEIIDYINKEDK